MRSWVHIGSQWHIPFGEDGGWTFCGRPIDTTARRVVRRDEDTPPFACSACLLAEPAPPAAAPPSLEYDPLRRKP